MPNGTYGGVRGERVSPLLDFLASPLCCEGILLHGALDVRVADVRIDLRGIELLVAQDFLQHAHVYLPGLIPLSELTRSTQSGCMINATQVIFIIVSIM